MKKNVKDKHLGEAFEEIFAGGKKKPRDFYARVYEIVEQIPTGKVTTYGAIAGFLGTKGSSRMVGQALTALPVGDIPAHRVINRFGALTGAIHFGGYDRMRSLLRKEGITFKGELVDMEKHFWKPGGKGK